jgi:hypothetical protein
MLEVGELYRPPNTTDIAALIVSRTYIPNGDRFSVKLEWYRCNKAGKVLYCMGIVQRFKKDRKYWGTWELLTNTGGVK